MKFYLTPLISGIGASFFLFFGSFANAGEGYRNGDCPDIPNGTWEKDYSGPQGMTPNSFFVNDYWVIPVKGNIANINKKKTLINIVKQYIPSNNPRFTCRAGQGSNMSSCVTSGGVWFDRTGNTGLIPDKSGSIVDVVITDEYIDSNIISCKNKVLLEHGLYTIDNSPTLVIIRRTIPLRVKISSPKPQF